MSSEVDLGALIAQVLDSGRSTAYLQLRLGHFDCTVELLVLSIRDTDTGDEEFIRAPVGRYEEPELRTH